jgi:hypothetical protein
MLVEAAGVLALPGELDVGRRDRDAWDREPAVWAVDEHAATSRQALTMSATAPRP